MLEAVVTLIVEDPDETWAGLKEAVAPAGKPVAVRATDPLNPLSGATVAVYVVPLPWNTVCEARQRGQRKVRPRHR